MSEIVVIPSVDQINLEHQLANSKASEAVQHATNCGLMLLQVKASLNHGEWLPWLNGEIESGRLAVKERQAQKYMQLASNTHRSADLLEAPSINAALELLSDKEPEADTQGALIDVEVERQARISAETKAEEERQARELFERRAQESQVESNERRKKIRELETTVGQLQTELDIAKTVLETQPEKERIVTPADYEATKQKASLLAVEVERLRKQQASIIQQQVTEKLKEREQELDEIERKVKIAGKELSELKEGLDRYTNQQRELQVHLNVIEKARVAMAMLAANLEGFESVIDHDHELRLWRALSQMLRNGAEAIDFFVGDAKPRLVA